MERRLATILAADVVGYSKLMAEDEETTLAQLKAHRADLFDRKVAGHNGRIIKLMGDGTLVEFASVVDAVNCAIAIQTALAETGGLICLRIGINLGDVIVDGDDIYGDGINIAARLETLAEPGGICISDLVHQSIRAKIDVTFNDTGEQTLKNIDQPVRAWHWPERATGFHHIASPERLELPDKPSIAVLPFDNMSEDPKQEYFAEGIAEDIITALSRSPWLFVIARNSSFTYREKSFDIKQMARELGVRFVLEGSVRRSGNNLRITAELIDGDDGTQVWAEKYDGKLDDVFELQDDITQRVVSTLHTKIILHEGSRPSRQRSDFHTWDMLSRAWRLFYELRPDSLEEARELMEKAIKSDNEFSEAHYVLAGVLLHQFQMGFEKDPDGTLRKRALQLVQRSIALDSRNEYAHWVAGFAYAYNSDYAAAEAVLEKAIELNPNCSLAYGTLGTILAYSGQTDRSIRNNEIAMRLNPRDPSIFFRYIGLAVANYIGGRYDQSLDWAEKTVVSRPNFDYGHALLIASHAKLGQNQKASAALSRFLDASPDATISDLARMPFSSHRYFEQLAAGLRAAGLRE